MSQFPRSGSGKYGGKSSIVVDNTLDRQSDMKADRVWAADITYIRTQESFAYLAVVIDLFSRRVAGWFHAKPSNDRRRLAGTADGCLVPETEGEGADPFR